MYLWVNFYLAMRWQNLVCPAEYGAEKWSQYVVELLNTVGNHRMAVYLKFILIWKTDCNSPKITFYKEKSHRQQTTLSVPWAFWHAPKCSACQVGYHATIIHLLGLWNRAAIHTARSVWKVLVFFYMGGRACINNFSPCRGNNKGFPPTPCFPLSTKIQQQKCFF